MAPRVAQCSTPGPALCPARPCGPHNDHAGPRSSPTHPHPTRNPTNTQEDGSVCACYFDDAVRNRTAKINDFFLKYLTGGAWGGG